MVTRADSFPTPRLGSAVLTSPSLLVARWPAWCRATPFSGKAATVATGTITLETVRGWSWQELAERYVPEAAWSWNARDMSDHRGEVIDRERVKRDLGATEDDDPRVAYVERACRKYLRGALR